VENNNPNTSATFENTQTRYNIIKNMITFLTPIIIKNIYKG